jgi:Flp pilus assembly pilin Flp
MDFIKQLLREEDGATMVEYAIMLVSIAAICIVTIISLGGKVLTLFTNVDGRF